MLEPSIESVLKSRSSIKVFYSVFAGILAICSLGLVSSAALLSQGWVRDTLLSLLSTLASSLAVIMLIYFVWILVVPADIRGATIRILPKFEISDVADSLSDLSGDYWFLGRGGSYFRSHVLPKLDRSSQRDRTHVTVHIVLPDPKVTRSAQIYRDMLQSLGECADEYSLLRNVAATVLAVSLRETSNPYLTAEISLIPTLPVLRFDISDRGALITRDAPGLPGVYCNGGNPCHQAFLDAVMNDFRQGTHISWLPVYKHALQDNSSFETCITGLRLANSVTVQQLFELIEIGRHRYA